MTDPTTTPAGFPPAIMRTLAARRRALGMTQQDIGERLGVARSTVAAWEREDSEPSLFLAEDYARAVGYDIVAQPSGAARTCDALCRDVEAERDQQTARLGALRAAVDELYWREKQHAGHGRDGHLSEDDLSILRDALDGQPAEIASAVTVPDSPPDAVSGRSVAHSGQDGASGEDAETLAAVAAKVLERYDDDHASIEPVFALTPEHYAGMARAVIDAVTPLFAEIAERAMTRTLAAVTPLIAAQALRDYANRHHCRTEGVAQRTEYGTGVEYDQVCQCGESVDEDGCTERQQLLADAWTIQAADTARRAARPVTGEGQ